MKNTNEAFVSKEEPIPVNNDRIENVADELINRILKLETAIAEERRENPKTSVLEKLDDLIERSGFIPDHIPFAQTGDFLVDDIVANDLATNACTMLSEIVENILEIIPEDISDEDKAKLINQHLDRIEKRDGFIHRDKHANVNYGGELLAILRQILHDPKVQDMLLHPARATSQQQDQAA